MTNSVIQFWGAPCLQHTNYVFYKAFKYKLSERNKILALGDFFFLKILQEFPICIGEVELLWEDKASNQFLCSLRLYFRPEHTPDGRQDDTGEEEVLALGERVVLRLDDLVPLIQEDFKWDCARTSDSVPKKLSSERETKPEVEPAATEEINGGGVDQKKIEGCDVIKDAGDGEKTDEVIKEEKVKVSANSNPADGGSVVKKEEGNEEQNDEIQSGAANLVVMNYPRYCRYRAMCRRIEGCENDWLRVAVVVAIGGFSGRSPGCKVLFCRDTFYQSDIDDLEIRMDHMLPVLKNRAKTKKISKIARKDSQPDSDSMEEFANITPSISSSSRPRRSTEPGDLSEDKVSTEEQGFLIGLHKFMHEHKMPIGRIPSLGFKQIDLFYFYKQAQKLGGYDAITHKRMWKYLYDKLGGNSSNTSAATCTRKHYERLLLPYERHLRKLKAAKKKKFHVPGEDAKPENNQKENVQSKELHVKIEEVIEIKQENVITAQTVEAKDDQRRGTLNENSANIHESREEQRANGLDHSKQEETKVLEIPVARHRSSGSNALPGFDVKGPDGRGLSLSQLEQLQQQTLKAAGVPGGAGPSPGDGGNFPFPNMVYSGGYLLPFLPPHLLQSSWGLMGASNPTTLQPPQAGVSAKDGNPLIPAPAALVKPSDKDSILSNTGKQSNTHPSNQGASSSLKAAHTNSSYISSPYLLNDHIQKGHTSRKHSSHRGHHDFGSSSRSLAPLLHPKPPGHEGRLHLPPAPPNIFLDPTSTNPFSPLQSSIAGLPPTAHSHPRKRLYPFDPPGPPGSGVFPSPDIVLDRIKNSTGLPRRNPAVPAPSAVKQRYDNPRDIFKQTSLSAAAGQPRPDRQQQQRPGTSSSSSSGSKQHQQVLVGRPKGSTNSKKTLPSTFSPFNQLSSMEAQQALIQQHQLSQMPGKGHDNMKIPGSSNGLVPSSHAGRLVSSQASPGMSVSPKDGRLTSALFGTQFTALPRSSKPSELPSPSSLLSDPSSSSPAAIAAASALSLNPILHPAFMNPFGNQGPTSSATSAVNSQLQLMANTYGTSPAQLYEEMLRQNGYAPFLAAAGTQNKVAKKN